MGRIFAAAVATFTLAAAGCGTTRMTDTTRSGSEMRLISQAIDMAVARLNFAELSGKTVFLDTQYLDGTVDKGYLISSIRQQLLAHGALLQEERKLATYIVEPRSGAVGTDKYSLLIGMPAITLPNVGLGVPTSIPEIALMKKSDQQGVAKLAVFAYNRTTGQALWQSELVESSSDLKDTWFLGAGPYRRGSAQRVNEFAGESIPSIPSPLRVFPASDPEPVVADGRPPEPKRPLVELPSFRGFGSTLFGDDRHRWLNRPASTPAADPEFVGPPKPE